MKISNRFLWGFVIILLALDWAALHDIIKGKEPDFIVEWAMIAASILLFSGMVWLRIRNKILK